MKKRILVVAIALSMGLLGSQCFAVTSEGTQKAYKNDLVELMTSNKAVIYALVVRTFNANDKNGDGIVEREKGEESGTFLNAIKRLDELKSLGINTIHLLPITPVGKISALGTAGSVYSMADFSSIDENLDDKTNPLSVIDEAKQFIEECHKRGIRVMLDLPSCGAVDMFKKYPELFLKDSSGKSVVPLDWTDVRVFKIHNADGTLNQKLFDMHKAFVDMCISLGIDGIRADVAHLKPVDFWKPLIEYARSKDPQFAFLAENSDSWTKGSISPEFSHVTQPQDLLKAGFDAYYGSYFKIDEWKTADELNKQVLFNIKLSKKFSSPKSVIGSFATHDEVSPINTGGVGLSKLIIALEATLPVLDPYFLTGFETGDTYIYPYENKKADVTYTDDSKYFVHHGKLDIFNYSRRPGGSYPEIRDFMKKTMAYRSQNIDIIAKGEYIPLKISDNKSNQLIAYLRILDKKGILVVANRDTKEKQSAKVYAPQVKAGYTMAGAFSTHQSPFVEFVDGKLTINLAPQEARVYNINFTK